MNSTEFVNPNCPICLTQYDTIIHIPMVFSCGHGICRECKGSSHNTMENCHVCRQPITSRAKNFVLIAALESFAKEREIILCEYNFKLNSMKLGLKKDEFQGKCISLEPFFFSFRALSTIVSQNYELLSKMARRNNSTIKKNEIWNKREEFIDKAISIYIEVENGLRRYTQMEPEIEEGSSDSSRTKLKQFENASNLLDQTVINLKGILNLSYKGYQKEISRAQYYDNIGMQNLIFDGMMRSFSKFDTYIITIQWMLEGNKRKLQETIKHIKEWCNNEMDRCLEGFNNIKLEA